MLAASVTALFCIAALAAVLTLVDCWMKVRAARRALQKDRAQRKDRALYAAGLELANKKRTQMEQNA